MMFNELALLFKTTFLDVYKSFEKYSKNENGRIIKPTQSFFFKKNWDSLHVKLNSHYETWSYKK